MHRGNARIYWGRSSDWVPVHRQPSLPFLVKVLMFSTDMSLSYLKHLPLGSQLTLGRLGGTQWAFICMHRIASKYQWLILIFWLLITLMLLLFWFASQRFWVFVNSIDNDSFTIYQYHSVSATSNLHWECPYCIIGPHQSMWWDTGS